jgi:hypothetical protein
MKYANHLHYLNQYSSAPTVKNYKSALRNFFTVIYGERGNLDTHATTYFTEPRDVEADVQLALRVFSFVIGLNIWDISSTSKRLPCQLGKQ